MFELGKKQELIVVKQVEFGVYLGEVSNAEERILLPKKQVPAGLNINDNIEVFIYKDSNDRIIATVNEPKLQLGQVAVLEVLEVGKIGAFLDWGLEKDLFLPFKVMMKSKGTLHHRCLYFTSPSRNSFFPFLKNLRYCMFSIGVKRKFISGMCYKFDSSILIGGT